MFNLDHCLVHVPKPVFKTLLKLSFKPEHCPHWFGGSLSHVEMLLYFENQCEHLIFIKKSYEG